MKAEWKIGKIDKLIKTTEKAIIQLGFLIERDTKESMSKEGGGRIYINKKIEHRASSPGQPPAVDTGRLRASISTNWSGSGKSRGRTDSKAEENDGIGMPGGESLKGFKVVVGTNVHYAPYLEFGTNRMAPRPYLRPSFYRYAGGSFSVFSLLKNSSGMGMEGEE